MPGVRVAAAGERQVVGLVAVAAHEEPEEAEAAQARHPLRVGGRGGVAVSTAPSPPTNRACAGLLRLAAPERVPSVLALAAPGA